ncbi:hypothetical protein FA13DRAFT_1804360 [Coprinellus micaceus]|uniref:Extracellular metalloproteinase n=1 Tax=Coprinellus micaceus TaxID=71717 RepID=A0A4Y7S8Q5_COPMI|nr:hypothetical protein FA13DRAFT_1804360 [Coprinellus micaceus]
MAFSKMFTTLLTTILLSAVLNLVEAAPWPQTVKLGTHRERIIGRGLKVTAYHPSSNFKAFGAEGEAIPTTAANGSSLGFADDAVAWRSGFTDGTTANAYLRQQHDGVPFANAVCNMAIQDGKVVSWGNSLIDVESASIAPSTPSLKWAEVLPSVENQLDAQKNEQDPTLEYFNADGAFYEAYVDAHTGDLVSVTDFVAHAQYTVLPITKVDFREGLEVVTDPQDLEASPLGWHTLQQGGAEQTTTSGNNVVAFRGQSLVAQSAAGLVFNSRYNDNQQPNTQANIQAAVTNAFFVINSLHDVTYRYGFTEEAFNFQVNNLGNGGQARDRVEISVQDASGTNNANFATPPDGQPGQCRMFIWTLTNPNRDGTMENDIIIHEFTHGVTNRLTGGGTGRCLQTTEAGGLGEGWGDAMADWFAQTSADTRDFAVGGYVTNNANGIRSAPYSTNAQTNPLTFASLRNLREVHQIGEVWANILHNVYAGLVEEKGFSADKLTNPDGPEGNIVYMRLFIASLAVQPCNPTFVQARDAWIQADQNLFNGANRCTLFKAFASRGLGLRASSRALQDNADIPADC